MIRYPIPPMSQPRARVTRNGTYYPKRYTRWRDDCAKLRMTITHTPILIFHVAMPKSWTKKKRNERRGTPHRTRPDLDNYMKAVFDVCLEEDSVIHSVLARKIWADVGEILIGELE